MMPELPEIQSDLSDGVPSVPAMAEALVEPPRKIVVGFWLRLLADIIDVLLLGGVGWAVAYPLRYQVSDLGTHALWIGLIISFLYYGLFQTRIGRGQTPGKRLLRIQVLQRDGTFLNPGKSFLRYFVVSFVFYNGLYGSLLGVLNTKMMMVIGPLFLLVVVWAFFSCFLMIPIHPLKRGLHDLLSGSVVVYKGRFDSQALTRMEDPRRVRRALRITTGLTLVVLLAAVWGFAVIQKRIGSDIEELGALYRVLSKEYAVTSVNRVVVNGVDPRLVVRVFLPLREYENQSNRDLVRKGVLQRIRENLKGQHENEKLEIYIESGFMLGIANLSIMDKGFKS
jgi:uncharacterized RDD family membrane protein YckC